MEWEEATATIREWHRFGDATYFGFGMGAVASRAGTEGEASSGGSILVDWLCHLSCSCHWAVRHLVSAWTVGLKSAGSARYHATGDPSDNFTVNNNNNNNNNKGSVKLICRFAGSHIATKR